jgi:hypothetical protein
MKGNQSKLKFVLNPGSLGILISLKIMSDSIDILIWAITTIYSTELNTNRENGRS